MKKEALALFMKIDNRRKQNKPVDEKVITATPKFKGIHEVKGLVFDMKFKEGGSRCRSRGRVTIEDNP